MLWNKDVFFYISIWEPRENVLKGEDHYKKLGRLLDKPINHIQSGPITFFNASWASQRIPVGHTLLWLWKNTSDAGFSRLMCEIVAIHLHCKVKKAQGAVYLSGLLAAGIDRPTLGIYAVLSFSLPSYSCIITWIYPSSMPACFGANNMGAWTLYDKHLPGRQVKNNKWIVYYKHCIILHYCVNVAVWCVCVIYCGLNKPSYSWLHRKTDRQREWTIRSCSTMEAGVREESAGTAIVPPIS